MYLQRPVCGGGVAHPQCKRHEDGPGGGSEEYQGAGAALARRLFDKFRKCTDIYCALWRAGSGIDQLAVAV